MPSETSQVLGEYFKSIEHSLEETLASKERINWMETLEFGSILLFILSVFPAIPSFLTHIVLWAAKSNSFVIKGHSIPLGTLWIWWPTCVLAFLALMIVFIKWESLRAQENNKKRLSDPQLRFACCYATAVEITKYQTNGIQMHADRALQYWKQVRTMLARMLRPFSTNYPYGIEIARSRSTHDNAWTKESRFILCPEVEILKYHFSWFHLNPETDSILEAFYDLPSKIQDRLKDKKDLEEVSSCLTNLSGYLYSRIPDIPTRPGSDSLAEYGHESLKSFYEILSKLTPYATEPKAATHPAQFWKGVGSTIQALTIPFAHPNIIACFLAWYVLTLAITLLALKAVLHFLSNMTIDTVLVSLIVGGPLACAVTAVAISRARKADGRTSQEREQ
jgi:hypothetical protein